MDRDSDRPAGISADTKAASINSRFTSPLTIIGASQRKSLFSRPRAKEEPTRPTSTGAVPETHGASPNGNTKIPRLSEQRPSQPRRPFTLTDAYHLAEEEEEAAAQGSPSPAPRAWRSRRESSDRNTSKPRDLGRKSTEFAREDTAGSSTSHGGQSQQGHISDASFDDKIRQHAPSQGSSEEPRHRSSGLFSKGLGSKIVETGKGLVNKNSRGSLEGHSSSPRASRSTPNSSRLARLLSSRKRHSSTASSTNEASDWVQIGPEGQSQPSTASSSRPTTAPSTHISPEKSFAWEAEEDFTAGDLQFSNSPPVNTGRANTKIDEIMALEAELADQPLEDPQTQTRKSRIDEIRVLEAAASIPLPDDPLDFDLALNPDLREGTESKESLEADNRKPKVGMDDRAREIDRLARRALATARIGEIRERGTEQTSRSPSPDIVRKRSSEPLRGFSPSGNRRQRQDSNGTAAISQRQEDLPLHERPEKPARDDSRHLLHRLSFTVDTNPLANPPIRSIGEALSTRDEDRAPVDTNRRRRIGSARSDSRPTVGFVGLRRSDSVGSGLSKKSGGLQSEPDPTERIEGEMNLFAPLESQSERGSLRAPSPEPEEEEPDDQNQELPVETPKVPKPDPLTQPTPRVTGAFVDTPATVKVERPEQLDNITGTEEPKTQIDDQGLARLDSKSLLRGRRDSAPSRQTKQSQSVRTDRSASRAASLSARRRARSLSRSRSLTNSAQPPTVQDDLLEIQRANQIEDSTLEDIADLLGQKGSEDPGVADDSDIKLDVQDELDRYERMSRTIKSGLLGIQSAKQGIQRLEDKFAAGLKSKPQEPTKEPVKEEPIDEPAKILTKDSTRPTPKNGPAKQTAKAGPSVRNHTHEKTGDECPLCEESSPASNVGVTYLHLPVPRLWYRKPKFRFTFIGLILFLLSAWYIAENTMCYFFCKPLYCYPGEPCDWSRDDPLWGYAIPVKLDQWSTGGRGRDLVRELYPEVTDWIADVWDAATGTDITTVDTSHYDWWQRRQHRRRLYKKQLRETTAQQEEAYGSLADWIFRG
ncbi:hypothetical protein QBC44DRAFT_328227 [Cladorrhinum sp. PSN332]|nr:hypothetical protein QBC44DRAFT_328227 [Cladorrhinum sp. PSN332]